MTTYSVVVSREGDAYIVDVPALPGCHTYGNTPEEALANAREAIELVLLSLRDLGEPIPQDTGAQLVRLEVAA